MFNRVRQRAQRASAAGPPFVTVIERLLAIQDNVVLGLLCRHDVPEALTAGPADAAGLAARLTGEESIDPDALHRVLRYAAMRGLVGRDRRGRFTANATSEQLRADHPISVRPWVAFLGSESTWRILERADEALLGREPSRAAHGTDFFTHVNDESPVDGVAFNGAMASGSYVQAHLLADAFDFGAASSLVDVGGGTGQLAEVLLRYQPHLRVTVFDLPAVVEAGRAAAGSAWEGRCAFVGGDFFDDVPAGGDLYTLLAILHDWGDDDAVRILSNVRAAMAPSARCLVVDAVLSDRHPESFTAATDILMLMLTPGGRERTLVEWDALVLRAGLRVASRRLLPTGFTVQELVHL
jgi:hypothetical protein